jgi:hypothetical protein
VTCFCGAMTKLWQTSAASGQGINKPFEYMAQQFHRYMMKIHAPLAELLPHRGLKQVTRN